MHYARTQSLDICCDHTSVDIIGSAQLVSWFYG